MPLRDHFRPPLDDMTSWEGFHGQWPAVIVISLNRRLPPGYIAEPRVHFGSSVEIDVAAFEKEESVKAPWAAVDENGGGVTTAVWAPSRPSLAVPADLPAQDEYEVRIYDRRRARRLVAAIEIVSPSNKDRPEHRQAFVAKCAALLQEQVSVVIVDLVTIRHFNLYGELLSFIEKSDPALAPEPPATYTAACRSTKRNGDWLLEAWFSPLEIGGALPTLPLWLADDFAVPLDLESSYEETCRILRMS